MSFTTCSWTKCTRPILLEILDIDQEEGKWRSGRFRDIYLNADGDVIILCTRNGGGNRPHWEYSYDKYEAGENCPCPGCVVNHQLPKHPCYIRDYDDDFDCTYAYVEFAVPEQAKDFCKSLSTGENPKTVHEKFVKTMSELQQMKPDDVMKDERFKPMVDILKEICSA